MADERIDFEETGVQPIAGRIDFEETGVKPVRKVGVLETAGRTAGAAAVPVVKTVGLALATVGGVIDRLRGGGGAQEAVFEKMDETVKGMQEMYAPKPTEAFSPTGEVLGGVAAMPQAVLGQGVAPGISRAAEVLERGGTGAEAAKAGLVTGGVQQALLALPAFAGGKVAEKIGGGAVRQALGGAVTGAAINVPAGIAGRAVEAAALPEGKEFEELKPEPLGRKEVLTELGMSAAIGAVTGGRGARVRAKAKAEGPPPFPADKFTPGEAEGEFVTPSGTPVTREMWDNSSERMRKLWLEPAEKAPEPPKAETPETKRLAEIERLKGETKSEVVKKALEAEETRVSKKIEADAAKAQAKADAAELRQAAGETTDPELQKSLRARADKLEAAEKIPVGEVKEGAPEIKVEEPKIPVGKVIEGAPEIKAEVPEKPLPVGEVIEGEPKPEPVEKIPVGEAKEFPSGVEAVETPEKIPTGEAKELYVPPEKKGVPSAERLQPDVVQPEAGEKAVPEARAAEAPKAKEAPEALEIGLPKIDERFMRAQERQQERAVEAKAPPPSERGIKAVRSTLEKGRDDGTLDKDGADLALWALDKNPRLAHGLKVSVEEPRGGAKGAYNAAKEIVRLFKGETNAETAAHEILHHSERMMPEVVQRGIRKEWQRAYERELRGATGVKRAVMKDIPRAIEGDADARARVLKAFEGGILDAKKHYQLFDPSEFWTVNGSRILNERFTGRGTWRAQARQWLKEMVERVKGVVGLRSDAPVLKALDTILNPQKTTGAKVSERQIFAPRPEVPRVTPDLPRAEPEAEQLLIPGKAVVPEETGMQERLKKWLDDLKPIERAQAVVAPKAQAADIRLAAKLRYGRAQERGEQFEKTFVEPLAKLLKGAKKVDLSVKDADDYLTALHAPERNAVIAQRNPKMPDGGSGLKNAQAQAIINSFTPEQRTHLDAIAKLVHDMNAKKLDAMVDDGLITPALRKQLDKQYKNYVPLKTLDQEDEFLGTGRGYRMRANDITQALGRQSRAGSPIAASVMDATRAIVRGEKARVDKAIWEYAQNKEAVNIVRPYDEKAPPSEVYSKKLVDGKVKEVVDRKKLDAMTMEIVVGGETQRVFVPDTALMEALKTAGESVQQPDGLLRAIATGTRFFSRTLTEWNVAFAPVNAVRDTITATIRARRLGVDATAVLGGIPKAMKDITALKTLGKDSPEYAEMKKVGGRIGAYGLTDVADVMSKLEKRGAELGYAEQKGGVGRQVMKTLEVVGDGISAYNEVFEYATRLSAYRNARAKGMSPERAAAVARDITLDFNVKGVIGRRYGQLYTFFNAALQGMAADWRDLRSPKTRYRMLSLMALGGMVEVLNDLYGGTNEETGDRNIDMQYENTLDSNVVLINLGTKIPLPPGIAAGLYTAGRRAARMANGGDIGDEAVGILAALRNALMPVRFAEGADAVTNAIQGVIPGIVRPFTDVMMNKDNFGNPIVPEKPDKSPAPHYTMSRQTTSEVAKGVSEFLNTVTGGDPIKPGAAQQYLGSFMAPEAIEYIVGYYTGGVGQTAMQSKNIAKAYFDEKPVDVSKIPVARRFVATEPKSYTSRRYKELQQDFEYAKDYQKAGETEKIEPRVERALPVYEAAELELRGLFKELRVAGSTGMDREPIQDRIKKVQSRVIQAFNVQPTQ
jgi:hypothetical protein